jgi:glucose/arabinose dehydrogenase
LNAQVTLGDLLVEPLATGLTRPLGIAHAGDGSGRLFFVEKAGRIMVWDGTQVLPIPFLDLSTRISAAGGEQGLLGLAFHPRFEVNGFFYVNYTDLVGDTVIARYSVSVDPNVADPASEMVLLTIPQPSAFHNGGQMAFGPDDFLYIATGDGGSGGDSLNNGQSLDTLLGKILRIDVDTGSPFGTPPTNPFVGAPGRDEIWSYGLRNPWRFSFDRLTGDIFIGDVGQSTREEIDFQLGASPGGENYGWRLMEGSLCFNPPTGCNDGSLTLPIIEYDHTDGQCSVTGGFRYRGSRFPALQGVYLYADFCTGRIWGASPDGTGAWVNTLLLDTDLNIATFGEDEEGELYLTHLPGTVYRLLVNSPLPQLTSLTPVGIEAGGPSFSLTVNGSGFVPASVVHWNGADRATTFVSPTELRADIPAGDIAAGGSADVTVFTPQPGGGLSNRLTFTVTDFSLAVNPPSVSVAAGQSASYTVTIAPEFGSFGNQVALSCSGLPLLAACAFSPSSLTPNNQPAASTLSISTAAAAALWPGDQHRELPPYTLWLVVWVVVLSLLSLVARERLAPRPSLTVAILLFLTGFQLACGGGGGSSAPPAVSQRTPAGTFTITVNGTSGSAVRTTTATLVVQ